MKLCEYFMRMKKSSRAMFVCSGIADKEYFVKSGINF
jgi:hypothetical protein